MPRVEIVGVYTLDVTPSLVEEALYIKGPIHFDAVRGELESVVLVEVIVYHPDEQFEMGAFGQSKAGKKELASDDQVAYDERFLSDDGHRIVRFEENLLRAERLRFAFWLHFYRQTEILTCYGPVPVAAPSPMPERLSRVMQYSPVS